MGEEERKSEREGKREIVGRSLLEKTSAVIVAPPGYYYSLGIGRGIYLARMKVRELFHCAPVRAMPRRDLERISVLLLEMLPLLFDAFHRLASNALLVRSRDYGNVICRWQSDTMLQQRRSILTTMSVLVLSVRPELKKLEAR